MLTSNVDQNHSNSDEKSQFANDAHECADTVLVATTANAGEASPANLSPPHRYVDGGYDYLASEPEMSSQPQNYEGPNPSLVVMSEPWLELAGSPFLAYSLVIPEIEWDRMRRNPLSQRYAFKTDEHLLALRAQIEQDADLRMSLFVVADLDNRASSPSSTSIRCYSVGCLEVMHGAALSFRVSDMSPPYEVSVEGDPLGVIPRDTHLIVEADRFRFDREAQALCAASQEAFISYMIGDVPPYEVVCAHSPSGWSIRRMNAPAILTLGSDLLSVQLGFLHRHGSSNALYFDDLTVNDVDVEFGESAHRLALCGDVFGTANSDTRRAAVLAKSWSLRDPTVQSDDFYKFVFPDHIPDGIVVVKNSASIVNDFKNYLMDNETCVGQKRGLGQRRITSERMRAVGKALDEPHNQRFLSTHPGLAAATDEGVSARFWGINPRGGNVFRCRHHLYQTPHAPAWLKPYDKQGEARSAQFIADLRREQKGPAELRCVMTELKKTTEHEYQVLKQAYWRKLSADESSPELLKSLEEREKLLAELNCSISLFERCHPRDCPLLADGQPTRTLSSKKCRLLVTLFMEDHHSLKKTTGSTLLKLLSLLPVERSFADHMIAFRIAREGTPDCQLRRMNHADRHALIAFGLTASDWSKLWYACFRRLFSDTRYGDSRLQARTPAAALKLQERKIVPLDKFGIHPFRMVAAMMLHRQIILGVRVQHSEVVLNYIRNTDVPQLPIYQVYADCKLYPVLNSIAPKYCHLCGSHIHPGQKIFSISEGDPDMQRLLCPCEHEFPDSPDVLRGGSVKDDF
jgi:hypothetical protein